jgi:hypothetical protein
METAEAVENVCKSLHATVLDSERLTVLRIDDIETYDVRAR